MRKLFLFTIVVAFAWCSSLAQDKNAGPQLSAEGTNSSPQIIRDGTNALLWDNFILPQGTTGIVSGQWGGLPAGSNQVLCADDFVIPSGETWIIDEIASTGFYSVGTSDVWGVQFWNDAGNTPNGGAAGPAVTVTVVSGNTNPAGMLSSPVVLSSGHYWVSIYGINNTASALATFRWNWYTSEVAGVGSEPYLIDLANFFGGTGGVFVSFTSLGIGQYTNLMFQLFGTVTGGCPVNPPTGPNPTDGATDVDVSLPSISWTNGSGTLFNEVYFGEVGNLSLLYDGVVTTSYAVPGPLSYNTDYAWRVVCKNDTCFTPGPTWTFTTMQDPNLQVLFCDDFESGTTNWTIVNNGGTCDWAIYNPPYPNLYTLPPTSSGGVFSADIDECGGTSGTTLNSTATITTMLNATNYQSVWLEFDNDWNVIDAQDEAHVEVSNDGGTTWVGVWDQIGVDIRNTHEVIDLTTLAALSNFMVRFRSVQPGWDWWWTVDNVCIYASDIVPVELTSFTATADYGVVNLNWITATETNNQGFEIQRNSGSDFETIDFVQGIGTTTESQVYTYSDRTVGIGVYSYRLKQVDFNGTYEYSNVVEVDVPAPTEFALEQNYPNPFNPSTKINFQLKVDSKVSLKVFDVLGQEVATLVNTNLVAGAHNVNFDASKLNSGVYLYRIEANGIDGSKFIDVKKMILTK